MWGYNKKNMGFNLTPKKVLLHVEPRGMRMQWKHTTLSGKFKIEFASLKTDFA